MKTQNKKMVGINALSLFDGMSCGNIALSELGVKVDTYYASEIEKQPMQVSKAMFPNTIYIGDVRNVEVSKLKYINLLLGGSPCQSFSFAGKRNGMSTVDNVEILTLEHYLQLKADNFEFEGQSYLFWEYMRILTEIRQYNPDVKFLLENVIMGSKWQKILTQAIGINPIRINSALVSAQNRDRLYWTNINVEQFGLFGDYRCMIPQPKDRGIYLRDILEDEVDEKYFLSDKAVAGILKHKENQKEKGFGFGVKFHTENEKMSCLKIGGQGVDDIVVHNTMPRSSKTGKGGTGSLSRSDGKTYCLDTEQTNAIEFRQVKQINPDLSSGGKQPYQQDRVYDVNGIAPAVCANKSDLLIQVRQLYENGHNSMAGRVYSDKGKSVTMSALGGGGGAKTGLYEIDTRIRRLTPREAARLQTVPEHLIDIMTNCGVKDSPLYKMIGNGWTIEVIKHILSYYNYENTTKTMQRNKPGKRI